MKITDKISLYLINLLIFIPILFGGNTKEIFEFPKTTALYIIGGCLILVFMLKTLGKKTRFVLPNIFVFIFVLLNIISYFLSSHKYTSFWGYYSRFNGGLASTLVLFLIYLVVLNNKVLYKDTLEKLPLMTLVPIGIYALFQHYSGTERAYSTLGQPNWLAAYLVLLIPLVVKLYIEGNNKMLFLYVLAYCSLWFSYSLSGLLGYLASVIVIFLQSKPFAFRKLALLAGLTLFISLSNPGIFKAKVSDLWTDIKGQLTIARQVRADQDHYLSDPGFIRFSAWKGTLNLIFSDPKVSLIGTGLQTFPYEFQKFRPEALNYSSEWNYIVNKPHNYYLELASEVGIFSLISYIIILWNSRKSPFLPSIAGFAVTNFFGWPVVPTAILFWLWLAYSSEKSKTIEIKIPRIASIIITVLIFMIMRKATIFYSADVNLMKSIDMFRENKLESSLKHIQAAMEKNPNEPNYPKQMARIYLAMSSDSPIENKPLALNSLEQTYKINPENLATRRDILSLYFFLAIKDIRLPEGPNNIDLQYLPIAEAYFSKLKEEHPTDAGTLADIAKYEKRLNLKGYMETREMVKELRPDLLTWHESFR